MSERNFQLATPRHWKNKESGKSLKVVPWFLPIDNESRLDFKGLLKEVEPTLFTDDVMADVEIYSGLVMQVGWLCENENNVWLGLAPVSMKEHFDDLGLWSEREITQGQTIPTQCNEPQEAGALSKETLSDLEPETIPQKPDQNK